MKGSTRRTRTNGGGKFKGALRMKSWGAAKEGENTILGWKKFKMPFRGGAMV